MKIQAYSFSKTNINNKIYTKDLILVNWIQKSGHELCLDDLLQVSDNQLEMMFVSADKFGVMKVSQKLVKSLKETGLSEVIIAKSSEVMALYNNSQSCSKALAIHLTC